MKPIVSIAMLVVSAFLNAADAGREINNLVKDAQDAIAVDRESEALHLDGGYAIKDLTLFRTVSHESPEARQAIQMLLDAGANPNFGFDTSVLTYAAQRFAVENIKLLRQWSEAHGDSIDPNKSGDTVESPLTAVLRECINDKMIETMEALLQFKDIDVNRVDGKGNTPLSAALEKVLQFNSTIWKGDPTGGAIFTGYLLSTELLVQHGAYVTEELLLHVDTALEQKKITHNQYDRIMGVLLSGRSTKSASSKG